MRCNQVDQLVSIESLGGLPRVFEVSELAEDELLRKRADSLIGSVAMQELVNIDHVSEHDQQLPDMSNNLAESISLAAEGDPQARELVKMNVKTDYFERAFKSGFVTSVEIDRNEAGQLMQNGQTLESVQVNSLKYLSNEKLKDRAKIEALHSMRDQYYADNGIYKEYARVTLSLVHDQMSDTEADEAGFFTQTRSAAIQFVTENEDGEVVIESAFVAGKQAPKSMAFDVQAAQKFASRLGVDFEELGSEDIHARSLLVHKSVLPDVLSCTQLFDEAAREVTGKPKFFGKDSKYLASREDYVLRFKENKQMISAMDDDVNAVVKKLIQAVPQSPIEATTELARLNDTLLKERIIADETIDAHVLGVEAAHRVEHARQLHRELQAMPVQLQQQNQIIMRDIAVLQQEINTKGTSSSCPGGATNKTTGLSIEGLNDQGDTKDSEETVADCDFISKECPKCGKEDVVTKCRNGKYYGDCGCVSA